MALFAWLLALCVSAAPDSLPLPPDTAHIDTARPVAKAPAIDSPVAVVPAPSAAVAPSQPVVVPSAPSGPIGPLESTEPVTYGPTMLVEIDTAGNGSSGRSTLAAVGYSLLVPGWGHRYLGYQKRATPYFATDLAAWATLFGTWITGKVALSNAAEIANRYGQAQLGNAPDPELLSAMRSYRSRRSVSGRHDSYDEAYLLAGKDPSAQFPDDMSHNWDWGTREDPANDAHIRSFENQVRLWRGTQVALYTTAGALALVRVVAVLDVLRLTRSAASRAGISLDTRPLPGGMDATLAVNF